MPKVAIVAALEREVKGLIENWSRVEQEFEGRKFAFFVRDELVVICGGIGTECARRAAEAVIALYHPARVESVGFAGALDETLRVGEIFRSAEVIDARDGSRFETCCVETGRFKTGDEQGTGRLVTFMAAAGVEQKAKLAKAYQARAVDMEAAGVLAAARAHGIVFGATKVISDELDFEMPRMADFIDAAGRFKTASFVMYIALRPWLWKRVAVLARNSSKAAKALAAHLERFQCDLKEAALTTGATTALPVLSANRIGGESRQ
jgi:adenosylhomocysteine nucleosidase